MTDAQITFEAVEAGAAMPRWKRDAPIMRCWLDRAQWLLALKSAQADQARVTAAIAECDAYA